MPEEPTEKKEEKPPDAKEDEGKPGDSRGAPSDSDKGSVVDRDSLRAMVKELLAEERATSGAAGDTARRADIEAEAERLVKEASARLVAEREAADKAKQDAKDAAKKAAEKIEQVPKKLRRVTKLMWGSDE